MGTVAYMSPEQARGQLTDARTDLFSLGTVLYQMATGVLPFSGRHVGGRVRRHSQSGSDADRAGARRAPAELGRIIDKALEKDRNLRYQTATELKTDLIRLKRDLESGSPSAPPSAEPRSGRGQGR